MFKSKKIFEIVIVVTSIAIVALTIIVFGVEKISEIITHWGVLGMIVYFLYDVLATILGPINSIVVRPIAVFSYGFIKSYILILASSTTGALINFYLARRFGKKIIAKFTGDKVGDFLLGLAEIKGFWKFLFFRLLSVGYFDYASYASGFMKVSVLEYLTATIIAGSLWNGVTLYLISASSGNKGVFEYVISLISYILAVISALIIWKWYKARKQG